MSTAKNLLSLVRTIHSAFDAELISDEEITQILNQTRDKLKELSLCSVCGDASLLHPVLGLCSSCEKVLRQSLPEIIEQHKQRRDDCKKVLDAENRIIEALNKSLESDEELLKIAHTIWEGIEENRDRSKFPF